MPANLESVEQAIKDYRVSEIVSCPDLPKAIPGSDTATALESGDTLGNVFSIKVPKSGIIISATFYDLDDEGSQVDLEIFKQGIADQAVDAAYAPTDAEMLTFLTELSFVDFDDQGTSQTSELTNIGKAYNAPSGLLYFQAVTRATPTIAAGSPPYIQLQILSTDSSFKR